MSTAPEIDSKKGWAFPLRFSLRSLMLAMLLVAAFLGGRASVTWRYALAPPIDGQWEANLPAGFVQPTTLQPLGEGRYQLRSAANVFSGVYQWRNGQLVVVEPVDKRMTGLAWKWDGEKMTLISEPKNNPTGASYTGTTLARPRSPKTN